MRPKIGITSGLGETWTGTGLSWRPYAAAVERAGGDPVFLDRATLGREVAVLADLRGVLFSGGLDVDLTRYPNPPDLHGLPAATVMRQFHMQPEPLRDEYELPLLQEAIQRDLPVLGICRGCQVLNVALGGRLVLDIASEVETTIEHPAGPPPERISSGHALSILPGTFLSGILAPEEFLICNSRHHQAVRADEALPTRVAAVCPEDGVIEAIEVPGRRWAVGVQWHPEHAQDHEVRERYAPLFRALVTACA